MLRCCLTPYFLSCRPVNLPHIIAIRQWLAEISEPIHLKTARPNSKYRVKIFRKRKILLSLIIIGWLLMVCTGMSFVLNYENTPGQSGAPPAEWPAESRIQRTPGLPTLVLMIHPHCPCSRATIGELALVMVRAQGRVGVNVLFVKPEGFDEDWEKTDQWHSAEMIPGVKVSVDDKGVEAQRFRSQTSGQAMLYGADGRLIFNGGITAARGHAGDNEGREALVALINAGVAGTRETPVFGCPLFGETLSDQSKEACHALEEN